MPVALAHWPGQVPVKVKGGRAAKGRRVMPSGGNDGMAIVAPDDAAGPILGTIVGEVPEADRIWKGSSELCETTSPEHFDRSDHRPVGLQPPR